jgi:hypothetical protein
VTVLAAPSAPTTVGDTICRTGSGSLAATGPAAQFRWYTTQTGGTPISGQISPLYNTPVLGATTTYYVSQVAGSCESPRAAVTAFVNGFNNAIFTVAGLPPTLTANPANGQFYQWLLAGVPVSGANLSTFQPAQSGDYSVIIRLDGCPDTTATQFVLVTDLAKSISTHPWKVYPNPVQHDLFVEGEGIEEVRMMNVLGQTVYQSRGVSFSGILSTHNLPNGVYWLEMKGKEKIEKVKVVVRR